MANKENIPLYIKERFSILDTANQNMESIFNIIHQQDERVFTEYIDSFILKEVTYTHFKSYVKKCAQYLLNNGLNPNHQYVGLLMDNSLNWVSLFWAILMIGGKPVLLNKKLPLSVNQDVIKLLNIKDVVSDSKVEIKDSHVLYFENEQRVIPDIEELDETIKEDWEDEIVLTTTATTLNYKICVYHGKDIYHAVMNARCVLKRNKNVKEHYNQRLKVLAFLPFYHIFGLMAAYFWFSIFGRTFIFLKDYSSETILKTIQRFKVTHVFGVPLLWNTIAKELKRKIELLPNKDKKKAKKGINFCYKLQNIFPNYARRVARKLLKPIQSQLFGDSVLFCISGGGPIPTETLYLINAIGYPLYNGYGSTEMGITSVELREKPKYRVKGTIGIPLDSINYQIENDELLIKGSSICSKIICKDGHEQLIDKDSWYHTGDVFRKDKQGYYYAVGRNDDVYVGSNGEKIHPDEIEKYVLLTSVVRYCFTTYQGQLSLIMQLSKNTYTFKADSITNEVKQTLELLKEKGYQIEKVYYTFDDIANENAIKVSRKLLDKLLSNHEVKLNEFSDFSALVETKKEELHDEISKRIKIVFSDVLNKDITEIHDDSDFFLDLGGSSLDYMSLLMKLESAFETHITFEKKSYSTVKEFYDYLISKEN